MDATKNIRLYPFQMKNQSERRQGPLFGHTDKRYNLRKLSIQTSGECIVFLFNNEKPIKPRSRRHFTVESTVKVPKSIL